MAQVRHNYGASRTCGCYAAGARGDRATRYRVPAVCRQLEADRRLGETGRCNYDSGASGTVAGVGLLEGLGGAVFVPAEFVAAAAVVLAGPARSRCPPGWAAVPPPAFENAVPVGAPVFEEGLVDPPVPREELVAARESPLVAGTLLDTYAETDGSKAAVPFVKILISWVFPSDHVFVKTMTVVFASITPLAVPTILVEPRPRVIVPPDATDTFPLVLPDVPLLAIQANEDVPFWLIIRVSSSHHGAPGPEAKPSPCHVPARVVVETEVFCLV